ncbi:hypothetical protein M9H77_17004 [Catharanthus roseus]|uniref:Uncharacterized protein n=1 Tax=Catharanthus roseus TaxID=4058 RepID=A0ACC0B3D7_CATRO|nr:hypothetical protein M9H77_17004 [Catharanthus roseus]
MVRPTGRRGDEDLGPVTDRIGCVQGCTVTTSSRGVRGRHSTSDLPSTPNPLPVGFHYDTGAPGSSTKPPPVPFRSLPPLPSHLFHTPVPYEAYRYAHPPSHPPPAVYDPYLHAHIGFVKEHDKVRSLYIDREAHKRVDDDVMVMMMIMMTVRMLEMRNSLCFKISGSRNKRPDKACDVPAPTQRKKVKAKD